MSITLQLWMLPLALFWLVMILIAIYDKSYFGPICLVIIAPVVTALVLLARFL